MNQPWLWQAEGWPRFVWDGQAIGRPLAEARQALGRVQGMAALLDPALLDEAAAEFLVRDSLQTSRIEGEVLDVAAVRSSVARHLGLPDAGLPSAARAVDGLVEMLDDATRQHMEPLTRTRLFAWHAALFPAGQSGLRSIAVGRWREGPMGVYSGRAGRETVHFEAPPADAVPAEMATFMQWFADPDPSVDGLARAALAHLWFETVHPFDDGNGRIGRAIADMALAQDAHAAVRMFSLSAQIEREKKRYWDMLERTQRGGLEVSPWIAFFLEQVRDACTQAEQVIARTLAKARFWMAFRDVSLHERQRKVINRLLDAGQGGFGGYLNNRKYRGITGASPATTSRDLADLVEKSVLVALPSGGRSTSYDIDWTRFA